MTHDVGGGCSRTRRGRFRAAREEGDGADRRGPGVSGWGKGRRGSCCDVGPTAVLGRVARKGEAELGYGEKKACGPN